MQFSVSSKSHNLFLMSINFRIHSPFFSYLLILPLICQVVNPESSLRLAALKIGAIRVRSIQEELARDKEKRSLIPADKLCQVCQKNVINTIFLECAHRCVCMQCGRMLTNCPRCNAPITEVVQTYWQSCFVLLSFVVYVSFSANHVCMCHYRSTRSMTHANSAFVLVALSLLFKGRTSS